MNLPAVLGVSDVLDRYGLRDRRAARRLMDEVGAFKVGANLYVRADDLTAHEEALISARKQPGRADHPNAYPPPRGRPKGTGRKERQPLPPDWWRDPISDQAEGSLAPQNSRR